MRALARKAARRWGQWLAFSGGALAWMASANAAEAYATGDAFALVVLAGVAFVVGLGLRAVAIWREAQ